MNSKRILAVAMAGLMAVSFAGTALARGGNGQGGSGGGSMTNTRSQTYNGSATVRPADSQRRDGTFLSSGVTANGSTTRPANGNGLQDGSGLGTSPQ
ncbi:MAG: hypothetical protein HGA96_14260 [Desulfobulbaceae bacterium]|nr:hypothetical protein [Desulfobulbaceae bacterium]